MAAWRAATTPPNSQTLERLERWRGVLADSTIALEIATDAMEGQAGLGSEEGDLLGESKEAVEGVEGELEKWRMELLLNGP